MEKTTMAIDSLGMPPYWPFNHIPTEYLWASNNGTTFTGHRGNIFFKLIRILSRHPVAISAKIPIDLNSQLNISSVVTPRYPQARIVKVLWYNAAQPNPGRIEARFPFEEHLTGIVESESPDILIFSSIGGGLSKHQVGVLLRKFSHTQVCQQDIGIDGGVVSVSHTASGQVALNPSEGGDIESGIELCYSWN